MSPLRQQLIEELVLRGCSERTQEAYVHQVYQLAKFHRQSPDQLSNEQVRQYLFHLARERKLAPSSINQAVMACRFLYERVLHREVEALRQATCPSPASPSSGRRFTAPPNWSGSSRSARRIPSIAPF
jgi:site-specific recombinase XerD